MSLLVVNDLTTHIGSETKPVRPVDGVSFVIERGQTFALLGESGCGKSMTALSLLRLNPQPVSRLVKGQVSLDGEDLLHLSEAEMEQIRGRRIAMIFQEPQSALNPVLTIEEQISEALYRHFGMKGEQAQLRVIELLNAVGIPDPEQRLKAYPHQMSGGMKQRVMIAIALAGEPELLIADEPTTALDVTIQAQILLLLKDLQRKTGMAILLISHDLAVVAQIADHVAVMYAGQIVETASRDAFFNKAKHPYSQKLFQALPTEEKRTQALTVIKGNVPALDTVFSGCRFVDRCDRKQERCDQVAPSLREYEQHGVRCIIYNDDLTLDSNYESAPSSEIAELSKQGETTRIKMTDLRVHFPIKKGVLQRTVGHVKAVDGVNLEVKQAETLAVVGESGCGKTTLGKAVIQLTPVTEGHIEYQGVQLDKLSNKQLNNYRHALQIIFQDPYASMNPRMTVSQVVEEAMLHSPLEMTAEQRSQKVDELLEKVGLDKQYKHRYPHAFSGGQRQRICIARALAASPEVIICDEPTSALDVSVQAQILNLLKSLQQELGLSYLFITHNLAVVEYLAHRIAVMYLGRIVEQGDRDSILKSPKHPYTQALLAAVPKLTDKAETMSAPVDIELPSPANPPKGCHFHQRCPKAMPECLTEYPPTKQLHNGHEVSCFLY